MTKTIPRKTISVRQNIPWLNLAILKKIRKRSSLYCKARVSGCCRSWKVLRNQIVKDLRISKPSYFMRLSEASSTDPNRFWCLLQTIRKSPTTIPTVNYGGSSATSDAEDANVLNTFFSQCFNSSAAVLTPSDVVSLRPSEFCPDKLLCSSDTVQTLLNGLKKKKAAGPDGISTRMLKATSASVAPSLSKLFNLSIRCCQIQTEWKLANIVPIPKDKAFNEASNYRPISFLLVVSKVLEKYIFSLIMDHLSVYCPLSTTQWGFLPGRSTGTALVSTLFSWFQQLENKREVLAVFFDLKLKSLRFCTTSTTCQLP